ncbi:MAG: NosD domain-containing protein [Candidatus Methanosuratincola sp.]
MEAVTGQQARGAILIQGNSGFTSTNGVVRGSGTSSDPYVIEGWSISANLSSGIAVIDTDAHFVIRDCVILGSNLYAGIYIQNASNGRIEGNTVERCLDGVMLYYSSGLVVTNNSFYDCSYGIRLEYSNGNSVSNNTLTDNAIGASISSSNGNNLTGNIIAGSSQGIYLLFSNNNTASSNRITDAPDGISLISSNNNAINGNTVINTTTGISLFLSSGNTVTGNTIAKGPKSISVDPLSTDNTVSGNIFTDDLPRQNAALDLQASQTSATVGASITISGTITPVQPGAVSIFWSINGSAPSLLSNATLVNGSFSRTFNLTQVGTYAFYAHWPGNAEFNPATSQTVTVASVAAQTQKTTPAVSISASKTSVTLSSNKTSDVITVTGTISPFVSQTQVNIRVTNPANQVTVIPVTATSSDFSANITVNAVGTWTVVAQVPEGASYSLASSPALTVTATAAQEPGGDGALVFAGAGVAAAVLVLVALLLMMRKKK